MIPFRTSALVVASLLTTVPATSALAGAPADLLPPLEAQARQDDAAFSGFSAERGGRFFTDKHGAKWSCASCHTPDPRSAGRHAATGKPIAALAPAANPQRLSDPAKVDKWFRRNCRDVLARECTAAEKGDVVTYLLSLQ
jgi:mono/diheme cytochrome c family protein